MSRLIDVIIFGGFVLAAVAPVLLLFFLMLLRQQFAPELGESKLEPSDFQALSVDDRLVLAGARVAPFRNGNEP